MREKKAKLGKVRLDASGRPAVSRSAHFDTRQPRTILLPSGITYTRLQTIEPNSSVSNQIIII